LVLAISIRAFLKGNVIAPYIFFGYLFFGLPLFVLIYPLSFSDFRSNETDFFYFAEAIRSIVFAVGVADRFWRVQRNSIRVEQEKKQLSIDGLLRLKTQREGIMQDLHDSLGGQLSSISLALNRLKHETSTTAIETIQGLANGAITELRNSLWVLENETVSFADLEQRINSLLWQYRKTELAIEFQVNMDESLKALSLPSSSAGHIFRIIQEATHNSIKHSNANKLVITFETMESGFRLIIVDDGIGFEKSNPIGQLGHYGLKNMAARTNQINGTFAINTAPSKGLEILITMTDPFVKSS
jgi:signal transduction histidine kinase